MLAIKNNAMANNAARHLGKAYNSLSTSVERLASGLRINSAKDDAAGLAVRELIRADIAILKQGARNAQDGISMLQTMEGAMAVMNENLIRMAELAEQAATGSYSTAQRTIMNAEFSEMASEIDRISQATAFNGITMLNSATGEVKIHVGTDSTIDIEKVNMTADGLGISTGTGKYSVTSVAGSGVSTPTETFFSVEETDGNGDTVTVNIQFTGGAENEQAIAVEFVDAGGGTDFSLQQVVDAINAKSQNINLNDTNGNSYNYQMAEAVLNTTTNLYELKLSARESDSDTVAITATAADADTNLGGWVVSTANITGGLNLIDGGGGYEAFNAIAADAGINIMTATAAADALTQLNVAINDKDTARASFGYKMNRLESTISILDIQAENLMAAESRISDVDVATEMAALTRTQVLSQAGISMLAQANAMPQMALSLLRG